VSQSRVGGALVPLGLGVLLAAAVPAAGQSPEEQALRLLEEGRNYRAQGKTKQALDNFNTIASGFSGTDSVDDALLEVGRFHLEVEKDEGRAREAFEQVAQRYPQSDGAPGAYYYLGWMSLARATNPAELEDALAQFSRVQLLYPRSEWVAKALAAAGLAHRRAGRLPEAVDASRRVSLEYPSSEAAAGAHFQVGHCLALLGEHRLAMEEFQQVRNRFPRSDWAAHALNRITALYRLFASDRPVFAPDPAFSLPAGNVLKDVRALAYTPEGTLWVASDKAKSAVPFGPDGKMGPGLHGEDLRTLALSPARDQLLVASKLAVRIGPKDIRTFAVPVPDKPVPAPVDKVLAAALTPGGLLLVSDEDRRQVLKFDAKLEYAGSFPDNAKREVVRILVDDEGGIVFLDRDEKTVKTYDEHGKLLRTLPTRGEGYELKKPVDVAVDSFLNAYVADETGSVRVFSPQGKLLATLIGPELKKPKALTLDPAGAVLVYDDGSERVLRYR
jgi:TolA-binding protein